MSSNHDFVTRDRELKALTPELRLQKRSRDERIARGVPIKHFCSRVSEERAKMVVQRLHLPRGDLVVGIGRETTGVSAESLFTAAESTSVLASISAAKASVAAESSIATEAASNATVRLVVGAVVPLDGLGVLGLEPLKELRNLLLGLNEDLAEVLAEVVVAVVEERGSLALIADTRGTANAVDVLRDASMLGGRQVVVDDVLDVGNIETTGTHTSSDHDGATTSAERTPDHVSHC